MKPHHPKLYSTQEPSPQLRLLAPERALFLLTLSSGAIIGGLIGQALAAAAAQSPVFAPYVHWLGASSFAAPAFVIGASLGINYAFFSPRAALWCPLARLAVRLHLPLLALAGLDIIILGKQAASFLFLAIPFSVLGVFLLRFVWRGAQACAAAFLPPPPNLYLSPRGIRGILAWPLCATIDYLALVPLFAVWHATSIDAFAGFVTLGTWSALALIIFIIPTFIILTRRNRPRVNAVSFALTATLHLALTAFYGAVAVGLAIGPYQFSASPALMPVFRVIAVLMLLAMPLAIFLLGAIRPQKNTQHA